MSMALRSGKISELIFLAITIVATLYYLWSAMQGKQQRLRKMEQVDAIAEGVDRAVEEGKPVYVTPGNLAYFSGLYAPMTVNGMNIVRYTARLCVRRGARVIFPVPYNPEAYPLIDGIFREACVAEGKPEAYKREDVRYYGGTEASFALGASADVARTSCSLSIMVGACSSAEIFMSGSSLVQGAMVIFGTPRYAHQATAACMSDYPLFCEDIYGAGAICSGDNIVASSLLGGDIVKLCLIGALILFAILATVGLPVVTKGGWLFQ